MEPKDFLDDFSKLGIGIERIEAESVDDLLEDGYEKINNNATTNLDALLQFIPKHLANAINNGNVEKILEGAYKVKIKDGMHLAKSKATEGAVRGALLSNANNQVAGQAEWLKIDPSQLSPVPNIALGVFDALSIVVGQYYMAQINHKLSSIEKKADKILGYMKNDKKSELYANDMVLNDILKNITSIRNNSNLRSAYLQQVYEIKRLSYKNINFFERTIIDSRVEVNKKSKGDEIEKHVNDLQDLYSQYWYSIYLYAKSVSCEVFLAEVDDPEYLRNIKDNITNHHKKYLNDFNKDMLSMSRLIDGSKQLNKSKIPVHLSDSNMSGNLYVALILGAADIGLQIYNNKAEKSAKKKTEIIGGIEVWEDYRDTSVFQEYEKGFDSLIDRLSSPIDIVGVDGDYYIKFIDEKE